MYENILIPTDGSKGAKRGVKHGLDLAGTYDATVHVLYVLDERVYGETPALSSSELALEKIEKKGEKFMAEIKSEAEHNELDVVTCCVRGVPYKKILDYEVENDIDLIVMGKHGISEHGRPHIGSTTERVVRLSDVPVLPV